MLAVASSSSFAKPASQSGWRWLGARSSLASAWAAERQFGMRDSACPMMAGQVNGSLGGNDDVGEGHSDELPDAVSPDRTGLSPPSGRHGAQQEHGLSGNECAAKGDSHLHLLLSYAGWQPDPWIERLPRLLEPMGVTSHVAATGRQASQMIAKNRIHVAVVDLGLPLDESGAETRADSDEFSQGGPRLLELLARLIEPPPVVVVKRSRTHRDDAREIAAALRMGAFAVVDRPHDAAGLNLMLEVLRRCLARHYKGCWPGSQARGSGGLGSDWVG